VLAPHKDRLPGLPAHVKVDLVDGGPVELVSRADAFFAGHGRDSFVCDAAAAVKKATSVTTPTRCISDDGLSFRLVPGNGRGTTIELGNIGHPARVPVTRDTAARTIVVDLPGHGASRDWPAEKCSVEEVAAAIFSAIEPFILGDCRVVAHGGSAAFGAALALKMGGHCKQLLLRSPIVCEPAQRDAFLASLPALAPTPEGGYLMAAWNWARTYAIFSPWEKETLFGIEANKPLAVMAPAPRRVHAQVVEMLRAGPRFAALWKSALDADLQAMLARVAAPVEIIAPVETEAAEHAAKLAHMMLFTVSPGLGDDRIWRKKS
jgi:pimeloyl-ACP methyl ester carboxylesterase